MGMPPKVTGKVLNFDTGYRPRPFQKLLHQRLKRFNVLVLHRRFGKSVFAINEIIDRALRTKNPNPVFGYFAPTFTLVEEIAWAYFKQFLKDIPGVEFNSAKLRITIQRPWLNDYVTIQLKSTDNPDSAIGKYYDFVVLDEYQSISPEFFPKLLPTLSDRKGGLLILGTPRSRNDLYDKHQLAKKFPNEWYTLVLKASESGVIPQEELNIQRASMLEEEYLQEFECSFTSALVGSYYGKVMEELEQKGQITSVNYDPHLDVDTFWDLGMDDSTTIWFVQQGRDGVRIIDYLEDNGKSLAHYVGEINRKPYNYRYHTFPHDVRVREMGTGKSREEILRSLGIRQLDVAPKLPINDGINAVRMLLPTCWFDKTKCHKGLEALRFYQREYDSTNKKYKDKPKHDWASHGCDAFRVLAMCLKPPTNQLKRLSLPRKVNSDYNIFG